MPKWNWEHDDWADFRVRKQATLQRLWDRFTSLHERAVGVLESVGLTSNLAVVAEILGEDAHHTSYIEGVGTRLDTLVETIRYRIHAGTRRSPRKPTPAERGIADLTLAVYEGWHEPLTADTLFEWNRGLLSGSVEVARIMRGQWRTAPVWVGSTQGDREIVHFVAPPPEAVPALMDEFIDWFNDISKDDPPYVRAAEAHMRFVVIHPFMDGNGRIARALSEKVLSQELGRPSLSGFSRAVLEKQRGYYDELRYQQVAGTDLTFWTHWLLSRMVRGMDHSYRQVAFARERESFFNRIRQEFTDRQQHVLKTLTQRRGARVLNPKVSVKRYASVGGCSEQEAVEDMRTLAEAGVFRREGNGSMFMVAFEHLPAEEPEVPLLHPKRIRKLRKRQRRR